MKMSKFSNHGRSSGSQTLWGLHVGKKNVQQPWQIGAVLKPRWLQVIPMEIDAKYFADEQ